MKRIAPIFFAVLALVFSTLACGLVDQITGGDTDLKTVSELWSDVPRIDGLEASEMEMPFYGKLLMRTMMNQFLGDGGKDTGDWIVFSSSKTADDIRNFYTNDVMAANGWESSENSTCFTGSDQGVEQVGVMCVFMKHEGSHEIGLLIMTGQDEKDATKSNILFIRVDRLMATPTP
jgi:hypothetical protein